MGGWKRIALTVKAGQTAGPAGLGALVARIVALLRAKQIDVVLDAAASSHVAEKSALRLDQIVDAADLLVVLGGDGSVLAAVRAIGVRPVPILGVNLGQLGFLTAVNPAEAETALGAILRGEHSIVERTRFEVTHTREGRELLRELVLNDAVITKGSALARLIELEAQVDGVLVSSYRSDGLIVATPTGSTAYNLSAGGPIVDPRVPAAILNPICPHTLSLRPLVLPDDREIVVRLRSPEDATLTLDGQVGATLRPGDEVRVVKASDSARFVSTPGHDHFETLRTKLGWGRALIETLRVRNLATIEDLELELDPGLTVVTGETGAGKSLLLGAIALLSGQRVGSEIVRAGAAEASVEATLRSARLQARARELGLADGSDEPLLVSRTLAREGRSRVFVNGKLATVALLAELVGEELEITSQGEHQRLMRPEAQGELLDAFAGLGDATVEVAGLYRRFRELATGIATRRRDREALARREDQLRFEIEQIERVAPRVGELEELTAEHSRLGHVDRLAQATAAALEHLDGDDGLREKLIAARSALRGHSHLDPELAEPEAGLERARLELDDASLALSRYAARLEADPDRLAQVEHRLGELRRLQSRYGATLEDVVAHRDRAREELESLAGGEERTSDLERELASVASLLDARSRALSEARASAAKTLEREVAVELTALELGRARLHVAFEALPAKGTDGLDPPSGPSGRERASFLLAANPGETPGRLRDAASGGELSRLLLALRNVLREADAGRLLLFDEIDAGLGGRTAVRVGERLRTLATRHQVICITHLPQLAALGDAHHRVVKSLRAGRTLTRVERLDGESRVDEVASMGGGRVTDAARAHARELLAVARPARIRAL